MFLHPKIKLVNYFSCLNSNFAFTLREVKKIYFLQFKTKFIPYSFTYTTFIYLEEGIFVLKSILFIA